LPMTSEPWPEELRLLEAGAKLEVVFDDGERFTFPAEFLRVESPSAEVKGHAPDQAVTVPGKRNVRIKQLMPVGNYAVRIVFNDGHDTGLYTWPYLVKLGRDHERLWSAYLEALKTKGLSRC
jgi:DUF971 family protein